MYKNQTGATLIEVLISVIILSIGLLGLAGLQATSIKSNQSSFYRSQATVLANDIADRMRSNRDAAIANEYKIDFPESSKNNKVTGTLAQQDLADWQNNLASTLPSGTAKIVFENKLTTIIIRWDDSRGDIRSNRENTSTEEFIYRTEI